MDVLQRPSVSHTPGQLVEECTSIPQSPDFPSSSDSASHYSFDSSESSQDSVASSATSVSTSWKDVLDQQQEQSGDPQDKVREYVSSVSQVAHEWANNPEGTRATLLNANLVDADRVVTGVPVGALFGIGNGSQSGSCLDNSSHRKSLSCINAIQPTKPPSEPYCAGAFPTKLPTSSSESSSSSQVQQSGSLFAEPQRPHPRRSSVASGFVKPTLRRDRERHEINVEHLVDSSASLVAAIWPTALQQNTHKSCDKFSPIISLRSFVRETLKRSRTSHSTLQVTLYYLSLIHSKGQLPRCDFTKAQKVDDGSFRALQCGRRMFLAALILASKYLQDANYSAKAWSKITGLAIPEITKNEIAFLKAIDYKLHVREADYKDWAEIVKRCTAGPCYGQPQVQAWLSVLKMLRFNCNLQLITKALMCLSPTRRAAGPPVQSQPCTTIGLNGRRSSLSLDPTNMELPAFISPKMLTNEQASPSRDEMPLTFTPMATPSRPATAVPPTPLMTQTLATPPGISPWTASRASYTPAASTMSSALSSVQSTPAARFIPPRSNSPCYERVVQRLERMRSLEKPMGACRISSHSTVGAPPSPQLTIASSSSDDELEASQPPKTVVSHGLPSPVQSSIASSDDEESMFGEVRIPETPATVAKKLSDENQRPSSLHRAYTESDVVPSSMVSPSSSNVFENVRNLLHCERSSHCTMATPRLPQQMVSAEKILSRKRASNDVGEHHDGAHKLRRITSSSN